MHAVLTEAECEHHIALHNKAYRLLVDLAEEGARDASLFSADTVAALREGATCAAWLHTHRSWPQTDDLSIMGHLLASLFRDSFSVKTLEWDGALIHASLQTTAQPAKSRERQKFSNQAVKRLARAQGHRLSWDEVHRVTRSKSLADAIVLWSWAYDLFRRAEGKESSVGLALWRAMPRDVRLGLNGAQVIAAQTKILARIEEVL